jgi:hypothetical protein
VDLAALQGLVEGDDRGLSGLLVDAEPVYGL